MSSEKHIKAMVLAEACQKIGAIAERSNDINVARSLWIAQLMVHGDLVDAAGGFPEAELYMKSARLQDNR